MKKLNPPCGRPLRSTVSRRKVRFINACLITLVAGLVVAGAMLGVKKLTRRSQQAAAPPVPQARVKAKPANPGEPIGSHEASGVIRLADRFTARDLLSVPGETTAGSLSPVTLLRARDERERRELYSNGSLLELKVFEGQPGPMLRTARVPELSATARESDQDEKEEKALRQKNETASQDWKE